MHHHWYTKILLGILVCFNSTSCELIRDFEGAQITEMRMNHYKATGFGNFPQLVYLVQEGEEIGGEKWEYFYDEISGFDFEPGYIYQLRVKKEVVDDPPQDASRFRYILLDVRSKEKVSENSNFEIRLKWGGHNFVTNFNDIYLLEEFPIDCNGLCENFFSLLEENDEVTGIFNHGQNSALKLISLH